jgi:flagellar basal body-associated protein FliL
VKAALLLPLGAIVLAAAALLGAARLGLVRLPLPPAIVGHGAAPRRPARQKPVPDVAVQVPAITTNLADAGGTHFAEVALTVEVAGPADAKAFGAKLPAIEDAVIADLRGSTAAELSGSAGLHRLAAEATASIDRVLGSPGAVRAVYFTQFVVQ